MPTEQVINFMASEKIDHKLNLLNFEAAWNRAKDIFNFKLPKILAFNFSDKHFKVLIQEAF